MAIIAPSILSADFANLQKASEMLDHSQADWFHIDVMDGLFVPNISFGFPVIKAIRPFSKKIFDVHLMIEKPEKYIEEFIKCGADIISVHAEACNHLHRNIQQIKSFNIKAGVAINPHTSISVLENVIEDLDIVCMMSVNPGFGGQKFIPQTIAKIKDLKKMINRSQSSALIEIDGGVTLENASEIIAAGADILVAGNTVFSAPNPIEMIAKLKVI